MRKIPKLCFVLLLNASVFFAGANGDSLLQDVDLYNKLSGVWHLEALRAQEAYAVEGTFSWGTGFLIPNTSIIIELGGANPYVQVPGFKLFLVEVYKTDSHKYTLKILHGKYEILFVTYFNESDALCFEESYGFSIQAGDDNTYYKLSGPGKKVHGVVFFTSTGVGLRIRDKQGLSGIKIGEINPGEKVIILETGQMETIGTIKGYWVKIKTESGLIGWCFDAFLKKVE